MSDMQTNGVAPPVVPPAEDPVLEAGEALLNAVTTCARKGTAEDSAAEAKDYSAAAMNFAEALIKLDPSRLSGGDTAQARRDSIPEPPPTSDGDNDGKIGS